MLKVLIVDDDRNLRRCLSERIAWEELGYEIVGEAADGSEAYTKAVERKVDVVISDLKMPVMDGLKLLKKLNLVMENVLFIFLSGYEDFNVLVEALKYNIIDYILKPIDAENMKRLTDILIRIKNEADIASFLRHLLVSDSAEKEIMHYMKSCRIQFFVDLFDELDYTSPDFSLSNIEEKYALSLNYMGRIFKKITGKTMMTFLIEMRLKKGAELLRETEIPIIAIAQMCGYTNQNYFSRAFKHFFSQTPSEYRETAL